MKIIVMGAGGRMGRALIEAVANNPEAQLVGAIEREGSSLLGLDAGEFIGHSKANVVISSNLGDIATRETIVIDFTTPTATLQNLSVAKTTGAKMVIGTTGFSDTELKQVDEFRNAVSFVIAGNYSVGVNLSLQLLRLAARVMGESSDIEVIEAHHKHKVDAPSGTALMMGEAAAQGLGENLKDIARYGRNGITGAREKGSIGFSAIRGGDIVGEHTVMFAAEGERLEISHKASSRQTFAQGAVRAAKWVAVKDENGAFSMEDVLGF